MGKRKIGEIYNKPIVEGDINLKTPNEIHKSELSGGGNNSGTEVKEWYYRVDWDKLSLDSNNGTIDSNMLEMLLMLPIGMSYSAIYPYDLGNAHIAYYDVDLPSPLLYAELMKNPENLVPNLAKIKAIKFKYDYSYPVMMDNITIIHGDIYTKAYYSINQAISIDELKPIIDEYYTEISKQEYEPLIERQITILGKK